MAIDVACQCGQRFKAKPSMAGKKVKCPKCGGVLIIPAASAAMKSQAASVKAVKGAASAGASAPKEPASQPQPAGQPCPSCGEEIPSGKVVCGNCHYSLRLKKRMRNTEVAETNVARGRQKPKQKPKKPMNKPLVFGVAAGVLLAPALLFGLGIAIGPEDTLKFSWLMGTFVFAGGVFWLRLLAAADSESNSVALFSPVSLIYGLIYAANNPREALPAFLAMAMAVVIWIVGAVIASAGVALTGGV